MIHLKRCAVAAFITLAIASAYSIDALFYLPSINP